MTRCSSGLRGGQWESGEDNPEQCVAAVVVRKRQKEHTLGSIGNAAIHRPRILVRAISFARIIVEHHDQI